MVQSGAHGAVWKQSMVEQTIDGPRGTPPYAFSPFHNQLPMYVLLPSSSQYLFVCVCPRYRGHGIGSTLCARGRVGRGLVDNVGRGSEYSSTGMRHSVISRSWCSSVSSLARLTTKQKTEHNSNTMVLTRVRSRVHTVVRTYTYRYSHASVIMTIIMIKIMIKIMTKVSGTRPRDGAALTCT